MVRVADSMLVMLVTLVTIVLCLVIAGVTRMAFAAADMASGYPGETETSQATTLQR